MTQHANQALKFHYEILAIQGLISYSEDFLLDARAVLDVVVFPKVEAAGRGYKRERRWQ